MPPPWPTELTTRSLAWLVTDTLALAPEPDWVANWRTGVDWSTPVKASAALSTERLSPDSETWTSLAPTGGPGAARAAGGGAPRAPAPRGVAPRRGGHGGRAPRPAAPPPARAPAPAGAGSPGVGGGGTGTSSKRGVSGRALVGTLVSC